MANTIPQGPGWQHGPTYYTPRPRTNPFIRSYSWSVSAGPPPSSTFEVVEEREFLDEAALDRHFFACLRREVRGVGELVVCGEGIGPGVDEAVVEQEEVGGEVSADGGDRSVSWGSTLCASPAPASVPVPEPVSEGRRRQEVESPWLLTKARNYVDQDHLEESTNPNSRGVDPGPVVSWFSSWPSRGSSPARAASSSAPSKRSSWFRELGRGVKGLPDALETIRNHWEAVKEHLHTASHVLGRHGKYMGVGKRGERRASDVGGIAKQGKLRKRRPSELVGKQVKPFACGLLGLRGRFVKKIGGMGRNKNGGKTDGVMGGIEGQVGLPMFSVLFRDSGEVGVEEGTSQEGLRNFRGLGLGRERIDGSLAVIRLAVSTDKKAVTGSCPLETTSQQTTLEGPTNAKTVEELEKLEEGLLGSRKHRVDTALAQPSPSPKSPLPTLPARATTVAAASAAPVSKKSPPNKPHADDAPTATPVSKEPHPPALATNDTLKAAPIPKESPPKIPLPPLTTGAAVVAATPNPKEPPPNKHMAKAAQISKGTPLNAPSSDNTLIARILSYKPDPLTPYSTLIESYTNPTTHRAALCKNYIQASRNLHTLYTTLFLPVYFLFHPSTNTCPTAMPPELSIAAAKRLMTLVKEVLADATFWEQKVEEQKQVSKIHAMFWKDVEVELRKVGYVDLKDLEGNAAVLGEWVDWADVFEKNDTSPVAKGVVDGSKAQGEDPLIGEAEAGEERRRGDVDASADTDTDAGVEMEMAELMDVVNDLEELLMGDGGMTSSSSLSGSPRPSSEILQETEEEAPTSSPPVQTPLSTQTLPSADAHAPTPTPSTSSRQKATPLAPQSTPTKPPPSQLPTHTQPILRHLPRDFAPTKGKTPTKPRPESKENVFDRLYTPKRPVADSRAKLTSDLQKQRNVDAKSSAAASKNKSTAKKERGSLSKGSGAVLRIGGEVKTIVGQGKVAAPKQKFFTPEHKKSVAASENAKNIDDLMQKSEGTGAVRLPEQTTQELKAVPEPETTRIEASPSSRSADASQPPATQQPAVAHQTESTPDERNQLEASPSSRPADMTHPLAIQQPSALLKSISAPAAELARSLLEVPQAPEPTTATEEPQQAGPQQPEVAEQAESAQAETPSSGSSAGDVDPMRSEPGVHQASEPTNATEKLEQAASRQAESTEEKAAEVERTSTPQASSSPTSVPNTETTPISPTSTESTLVTSPLSPPPPTPLPTPSPTRLPPTEPAAMRIPTGPAATRYVPRYITTNAGTHNSYARRGRGNGNAYSSASLPRHGQVQGQGGSWGRNQAQRWQNGGGYNGGSLGRNAISRYTAGILGRSDSGNASGSGNGNMQPPFPQPTSEYDVGFAAGLFAAGMAAGRGSFGRSGGRGGFGGFGRGGRGGRGAGGGGSGGRGGYGSLGRMGRF
ncbi:hypothetical protein K458DRAFT_383735 [Lentithecium fluviatile CBS 122367]|uniref:Uncharacterized protein n=1 Tax=Lentithecium fluviatile CBS 122367 TaxID=1168545 RepID=A0A6G1JFR9_9PLEO|nr:hypothetical protein K458DRAFT_383735 [Lentithecium fluviatile CBS 122367]